MDTGQVRTLIIRTALQDAQTWSQSAENLVLGIGMVESGYEYIHQLGNGPALGFFQIEAAPYSDVVKFIDTHSKRDLILRTCGLSTLPPHETVIYNLRWAVMVTRMFFARWDTPLPSQDDYTAMAALHKSKYNVCGATDVKKSVLLFKEACQCI